jgi:hypothetical protein
MATKTTTAWTCRSEWDDSRILAGPTGWIVEYQSRTQGGITGRRVLVPYGDHWPRGCDLDAPWNALFTLGEALFFHLHEGAIAGRVLRRGDKVC